MTQEAKHIYGIKLEAGDSAISVIDKDGKLLHTFNTYQTFHKITQFISAAKINLPWINNEYNKSKNSFHYKNKRITDVLGRSASAFLKHYNSLAYKVFVAKHDNDLVKKFCISGYRKQINPNALKKLNRTHALLTQVKQDKIENIAPLVFACEKSPQELREKFGKGLWKTLTKNTFHRNKILTKVSQGFDSEGVKRLNSYPSTLLQKMNPFFHSYGNDPSIFEYLDYATKRLKGKWKEADRYFHYYRDTKNMCQQQNQVFNPNWNADELIGKHHELVQTARYRRYSGYQAPVYDHTEFDVVKELPQEFKFFSLETENEHYTAQLISCGEDLKAGGDAMHHCVASYLNRCKEGSYLVYSIKQGGERYSTLGILSMPVTMSDTQEKTTTYYIDQHYRHCNREVESVVAINLAYRVVNALNKLHEKENTLERI